MGTRVRMSTFETNSSSSHSVAVAAGDLRDRAFSKDAIRSGVVVMRKPHQGDYDRWFRYYTPENILTFMIVAEVEDQIYRKGITEDFLPRRRNGDFDALPELCRRFPGVRRAISHLRKTTGLEFKFVIDKDDDGGFDTGVLAPFHGYLDDVNRIDALLFDSRSYVETNEENGWPDKTVPTDLGTVVETGYDLRWATSFP